MIAIKAVRYYLVFLFISIAMVQGKLYLIQSRDPGTSSTSRWRPSFTAAEPPSYYDFCALLANHISIPNDARQSLSIELYDPILGAFAEVLTSENLLQVISDPKPTQLLVKFETNNNQVAMIRGRAFDTSNGLTIAVHDGYHTIYMQEPGQAHLGTGLNTWDGSIVLAKYLEKHAAHLVTGKRILELGAGTGIAGMTAALLGAELAVLTDLDYVLPNLEANVRRNIPHNAIMTNDICINTDQQSCTHQSEKSIEGSIKVQRCDWKDESSYPNSGGRWDVILGADIVWIESLVPSLVNTLANCAHEDTTILISHQVRCSRVLFILTTSIDCWYVYLRHGVVTQTNSFTTY